MGKTAPIRILVVDDFSPWLSFVYSKLEKEPDILIVGAAMDGDEAVAQAQNLQPDLVLMDIGLPTLNGIEAARQITRTVPKAKIIYVSLHREPLIVQTAIAAGGQGYVVKWDVGSELLPAIRAIVRGERYFSRLVPNFETHG